MIVKNLAIVVPHFNQNEYRLPDDCFIHYDCFGRTMCYDGLRYLAENIDANYYGIIGDGFYLNFAGKEENGSVSNLTDDCIDRFGLSEAGIMESMEDLRLITYIPGNTKSAPFPERCVPNLKNYAFYRLTSIFPHNMLKVFEQVLKERHSEYAAALRFAMKEFDYFYKLNFVMDKAMFHAYYDILLEIIEKVQPFIDEKYQSYEGLKYKNIIAQLLLRVFEADIQLKNVGCAKRVRPVTFARARAVERVIPAFEKRNIPIISLSSNEYSPYLAVWLQSIMDAASPENHYDIIIFESRISEDNKSILMGMVGEKKNFSLRFLDPEPLIGSNAFHIANPVYCREAYYRVFTPWILEQYDKAIVMDCDLVAETDLSALFDLDMDGALIAGVADVAYQGMIALNKDRLNYTKIEMGMKEPRDYINTGVLVMDLAKIRVCHQFAEVLEFCTNNEFKIQEQDALNAFFDGRLKHLDLKWNYYVRVSKTIETWVNYSPMASKDTYLATTPWIVHYANHPKPWENPLVPYSANFWKYARETPYYELILYKMMERRMNQIHGKTPGNIDRSAWGKKEFLKTKIIKPAIKPFLPVHSMRREYLKELSRAVRGKPNRFAVVRNYQKQYSNLARVRLAGKLPWTFAGKNRKELSAFKDIHKGERCFFIGLGPSLRIDDLDRLKGEVTFAVNNVFPLFNKTDWRPTYYFNQETISCNSKMSEYLEQDLQEKYLMLSDQVAFFPLNKRSKKIKMQVPNAVFIPIVNDWATYFGFEEQMRDFSPDCSKAMYAGYLSMYSLLQLAFYMGFREIILLGCDGKYSVAKPHCYDRTRTDDIVLPNQRGAALQTQGINRGFENMRWAADEYGMEIYNATRGGYLEVFPRIDFDSLSLKGEN